jgi:hypothetical protein
LPLAALCCAPKRDVTVWYLRLHAELKVNVERAMPPKTLCCVNRAPQSHSSGRASGLTRAISSIHVLCSARYTCNTCRQTLPILIRSPATRRQAGILLLDAPAAHLTRHSVDKISRARSMGTPYFRYV